MTATTQLQKLTQLDKAAAAAAAKVEPAVNAARKAGATWAEIGEAMGTNAQVVNHRYAGTKGKRGPNKATVAKLERSAKPKARKPARKGAARKAA